MVRINHRLGDILATSRKLSNDPTLAGLIGGYPTHKLLRAATPPKQVLGWGYKPSGMRALEIAKAGSIPVLLEDGFLRSIGRHDTALSLVFDHEGIYYAAQSDSRLFDLISRPLSSEQAQRARALADQWRDLGLSKYNSARDYGGALPGRFALVIDQVRNDLSIPYGLGSEQSFARMLEQAKADDPGRMVVVKIHPDSLDNPEKRHFDIAALKADPKVVVLAEPCHIASIIAAADAVYTVTSQVGFEALMHGKPVHVFGRPFYAGWGLTKDDCAAPARGTSTLEQLVHAALVDYPRYWNPVRHEEIEAEDAMALVGHNRRLRGAFSPVIYAHGFSPWKRPFIAQFLAGSEVRFVREVGSIPEGAILLVWGRKPVPSNRGDLTVLRIEDGFLRSSGLGADLVRPLSLVIDEEGIYYDCSSPSRLETILATRDYTEEECRRAAKLREAIVEARLSKYNLGGSSWKRPDGKRSVFLVVGQVEDDASILFGSPNIQSNIDLLRQVREANPQAYLVYKPHPDVVAGLRAKDRVAKEIAALCDEMVVECDPMTMLDQVDEVHTMTSLMGFEALLRGIPVTCYGLPFYAGWGLTSDLLDCPRRTRRRSLDELVHAALIDYPRYFSARGNMFATPEDVLVELQALAVAGPATRSPWRRAVRPVFALLKKLRG